jgi:uridylate kinase
MASSASRRDRLIRPWESISVTLTMISSPTDTTSSLRAAEIDADIIFKATLVDGVYDSDPNKNPDAVRYDRLSFSEILNKELTVMDMTAASMCKDNHIPILVFSLDDPDNIVRAVQGEEIGTLVQ